MSANNIWKLWLWLFCRLYRMLGLHVCALRNFLLQKKGCHHPLLLPVFYGYRQCLWMICGLWCGQDRLKGDLVERQGSCWLVLLFHESCVWFSWEECLGNSNDCVSCVMFSALNAWFRLVQQGFIYLFRRYWVPTWSRQPASPNCDKHHFGHECCLLCFWRGEGIRQSK